MTQYEMIEAIMNSKLDENDKLWEIRVILAGGRSEEVIKKIIKKANRQHR